MSWPPTRCRYCAMKLGMQPAATTPITRIMRSRNPRMASIISRKTTYLRYSYAYRAANLLKYQGRIESQNTGQQNEAQQNTATLRAAPAAREKDDGCKKLNQEASRRFFKDSRSRMTHSTSDANFSSDMPGKRSNVKMSSLPLPF